MKRIHNKGFAENIAAVILVIVGALVIIAILSPAFRNLILAIIGLGDSYTKPALNYNNTFLFTAEYVGFLNNTNDPIANGQPPSSLCRITSLPNRYECLLGVSLKSYVVIRNTGSGERTLYSRPRVGWECNPDNDDCNAVYWKDGHKACVLEPKADYNCPTNNDILLNLTGVYHIYPGSVCLPVDCPSTKPEDLQGIFSYNKDNYVTITVYKDNFPPTN